jgi:RNA polymerase sigma factor (sigma-70 family)
MFPDETSLPAPVSPEGKNRQLLTDFLNKEGGLGFLTTVCASSAKARGIDANDLVQETIIRTIAFLERDVARDITCVLCTIAYRVAEDLRRDKARQQKRRRHIEHMNAVPDPTNYLKQRIEEEHLQIASERLCEALKAITPKRQRIVAKFRVWRCMPKAQIAQKLDVSRGTVLNDWQVARAKLSLLLPEYSYLLPA